MKENYNGSNLIENFISSIKFNNNGKSINYLVFFTFFSIRFKRHSKVKEFFLFCFKRKTTNLRSNKKQNDRNKSHDKIIFAN